MSIENLPPADSAALAYRDHLARLQAHGVRESDRLMAEGISHAVMPLRQVVRERWRKTQAVALLTVVLGVLTAYIHAKAVNAGDEVAALLGLTCVSGLFALLMIRDSLRTQSRYLDAKAEVLTAWRAPLSLEEELQVRDSAAGCPGLAEIVDAWIRKEIRLRRAEVNLVSRATEMYALTRTDVPRA